MRLIDIPRMYSIRDIVPGLERRKWCVCPLPQHIHSNNTPSFSMYTYKGKEFFKCHGNCELQGDVIDLIGYMNIPGYKQYDPAMYRQAASILTNGKFKPSFPETRQEKRPELPDWLWREMLPPTPKIIAYAMDRGLTPAIMEKFNIGTPRPKHKYSDIWMAMPTIHLGSLMGIKLRNTGPGTRYINVKGSRKGLFNYDGVADETGTVLILKGEIAVMVADRFGFTACAPTAGEGSYVNSVKPALALARKLIVVGDNDPEPNTQKAIDFAERRAATLGADVQFPPRKYKDIDEWLLNDKKAADIIRSW